MYRRTMMAALVAATAMAAAWTLPAGAQEAAKSAPLPGGYTFTQLMEVLTKLGLEPKEYGTSKDRCWFTLNRGDFSTSVACLLSQDGRGLWFQTGFATPASFADADPAALKRLLQENDVIGPANFRYDAANKQLQLTMMVPNRDWTPARLKKEIEAYDDILRKREPLWRIDNFLRLAPVPEELVKPELAKLQGVWKLVDGTNAGKPADKEALAKSDIRITIQGNVISYSVAGMKPGTIFVDPSRPTSAIDVLHETGRVEVGVYVLDGDRLKIQMSVLGQARPADLNSPNTETTNVLILERVKA